MALKLSLPGDEAESTKEEASESPSDESEEHGTMLKKALDSGDGAAICEAVKRIMSY